MMQVDPDWWKFLFDDLYLVTDARSVCDDELTCREIDLFCNLISMEPGDLILDLCGGHGRHSLELGRRGFVHCTVFDYSDTLLRIGGKNAERCRLPVQFVKGDARALPFEPSIYHHVLILGNSLGYIPEQDADKRIIGESYRTLQPGGRLLIDVTDGRNVRRGLTPTAWHEIGSDVVVCREREIRDNVVCAREMVFSKKNGLVRDRTYCIRLFEASQLTAMVADAGFKEIRVHDNFSPAQCDDDLGFMNHRMVVTAKKP
jgi:D-alanine-D-alanine ligase